MDITKDEAFDRLKKLCSKKEIQISEIKKKLNYWKIKASDINEIIANLKAENFIDEARFCKAFVNDKFKFNKWGKIKIAYDLKINGFSNSLIDDALDTIDENLYKEMLEKEIEKKLKSLKTKSSQELKFKIINFARQRGYETDLIIEVLNNYLQNGN